MNRRRFLSRATAAALSAAIARWPIWRERVRRFPGKLCRLRDWNWKEPGAWMG